jgi:hypothetical protein
MAVPDISMADIDRRFNSHVADEAAQRSHAHVTSSFILLAATALFGLPAGREKSLAFTALEEASFWAHAAIARQGS